MEGEDKDALVVEEARGIARVTLKGAGKHFCAGLDLTQQKPGAELGPERG